MKTQNIFAYASLLAVAGTAVDAQSADAVTSDEQVKEDLRQAICLQDWNKAVELSGLLMASSMITPEHRQTLVEWRYRFSDYAVNNIKFESIPNCGGMIAPASRRTVTHPPIQRSSLASVRSRTDQTKENLRQAICTQDWQKAVDVSSLLIAAPDIAPEHRQLLVAWRARFSNYAAAGTQFESLSDCHGVNGPFKVETFEDNRASIYFDWDAEVAKIPQGTLTVEPRFAAVSIQNSGVPASGMSTSNSLTVANVYSRGGTVYGIVENNTGTVYRDIEVYAIGYTATGATYSETYTQRGVINPGSKIEIPVRVGGSNLIDSDFYILSSSADPESGPCNFPGQIDAAGRRCGDRAASARPGGY